MAGLAQCTPSDAVNTRPIPTRRRQQSTINSLASSTVFAVQIATTTVLNQNVPLGFFAASAEAASSAPSISEVRRRGSSLNNVEQSRSSSGRHETTTNELQHERILADEKSGGGMFYAPLTEEPLNFDDPDESAQATNTPAAHNNKYSADQNSKQLIGHESRSAQEQYLPTPRHATSQTQRAGNNGGNLPKRSTSWLASASQFLKIFWRWFCTPFGFLLTIYGLNVVAWGGMIFLLLCNAAPAMCSQDTAKNNFDGCNDINSPRRIWIEIDSQILNALFCVTGLGLFPWRARDLYYLLRFRFASKRRSTQERLYGLRVLAGIHRGWFRLPGHDTLGHTSTLDYLQGLSNLNTDGLSEDPRVPLHRRLAPRSATSCTIGSEELVPSSATLAVTPLPLSIPLTGIYATPTKAWKLDFFIYCQIGNTAFQCCLCGLMWGLNRHNRPGWSTGLFVVLACGISGVGGLVSWWEGRRVKKVEGETPRESQDLEKIALAAADLELQRTKTGRESVVIGGKDVKPRT